MTRVLRATRARRDYYAAHRYEPRASVGAAPASPSSAAARLRTESTPASTRDRIIALLHTVLAHDTSADVRVEERSLPLTVKGIQPLAIAGGAPRHYVTAQLRRDGTHCSNAASWLSPRPELRTLALDVVSCSYDAPPDSPPLVNVVHLGLGRTGLIVTFDYEDGEALERIDDVDGSRLGAMRVLWSIGAGE